MSHPSLPTALSSAAVSKIKRITAVDTVRARISMAVTLGLLPPGERLPSEAAIAATLGVGEITARRAIESLAEEGVLERRRGRAGGTFVALGGPARAGEAGADAIAAYLEDSDEVHRLIDVRVLLEAALTHHAALHATSEHLDGLQRHIDAAASATSWAEFHLADEQFHRGVARSSGLEWAIGYYESVLADLYAYFLPYPIAYLRDSNTEHVELLAALRRRDPVTAVRIIEAHVGVLHDSMFMGPRRMRAEPGSGLDSPTS